MRKINLPNYLILHCYALLGASLWAVWFQELLFPTFLMVVSFVMMVLIKREQWLALKPFGGYANWATVARFSLLVTILLNLNNWSAILSGSLLILFLCMDGLDGFLARKYKMGSELGASLDMESDAFYCAMLSIYWFNQNADYWWVLIPGLMRYAYTVIVHLLGISIKPEKLHPKSKWFAVAFFIALVSPFFLQTEIAIVLLFTAMMLILYSFGYAFYHRVRK